MAQWKRTARTTKCSDPTEYVVWEKGELSITEFQNVYTVDGGGTGPHEELISTLGKELHQALEFAWQTSAEACSVDGVDYDAKIYGGE